MVKVSIKTKSSEHIRTFKAEKLAAPTDTFQQWTFWLETLDKGACVFYNEKEVEWVRLDQKDGDDLNDAISTG